MCIRDRSYLFPASHRENLNILRNALTTKILFDGSQATGATVVRRGTTTKLYADQVFLCAGAINSPQLLMLSGIGPAEHLHEHGITMCQDLPGVGQNLMDHLEIYVQQACTQPLSLYRNLGLFGRAKIGLEWVLTRRGLGATSHFETGGFIRRGDAVPYVLTDYPSVITLH